MGNQQVKKTPQELMLEAQFKLRMSSKRFARESKKCDKEKKKNIQKAEQCLKKGDEHGARMYVANAQNNINDYKKYLTMSSKLDSIASKLKSNQNSQEVMQYLAQNVTPALVENAESMDIKTVAIQMEKFQDSFDKMTVNANIMNDNFNQLHQDGNTVQESDELFTQLKNKVQNDIIKDLNVPMELNQSNTDQNKEKDTKLEDYLKELKSM